MLTPSSYKAGDIMRHVIEADYTSIITLNRFDIALGFGESDIGHVCDHNGIDCNTFLAVLNFISGRPWQQYQVDLRTLMLYLRRSHSHFSDYALPAVKKTLIEGIRDARTSETGMLILKFYDEYVDEVKKHIDYENEVIFGYVERLLAGKNEDRFAINDFSAHHSHLAGKLDDLKNLFIYRDNQENNELIYTALMQIMNCGRELIMHCELENHMLFPLISDLESRVARENCDAEEAVAQSESLPGLSRRECEIIRCVTLGLANKEIADRLNLSFHTVTTYRKNIAAKLNIHSSAGLAVYAILHKIVPLEDLKHHKT